MKRFLFDNIGDQESWMSLKKYMVTEELEQMSPARTYLPRVGEVVMLRSGSPVLIVVDTDGVGDEITVSWRNEDNYKVHEMTLPSEFLEVYEEIEELPEEELED